MVIKPRSLNQRFSWYLILQVAGLMIAAGAKQVDVITFVVLRVLIA